MLDLRDQIKLYFDETAPPVETRLDLVSHPATEPERRERVWSRRVLVASLAFVAVITLIVIPLLLSRGNEPPPATQLPAPPTTVDVTFEEHQGETPTVEVASSLQPIDLATAPAVEPPDWTAAAPPPGWRTTPWEFDSSAGDLVAFLRFPDFEGPEPVLTTEDGIDWIESVTQPAPNASVMRRQSDGIWLGNRGRDRFFSIDGEVWQPIAYQGGGDFAIADGQVIVVEAGEGALPTVLAGPLGDPNPTLETTIRGAVRVDGPVLIETGPAVATSGPRSAPGLYVRNPDGDWAPTPLPKGTQFLRLDAGRIYAVVQHGTDAGWALFWSTGNGTWNELVAFEAAQFGQLDAVESGVAMIVATGPDAREMFFVWAGHDGTVTWQPVEPRTSVVAADSFMLRWTFDPDTFSTAAIPGGQ